MWIQGGQIDKEFCCFLHRPQIFLDLTLPSNVEIDWKRTLNFYYTHRKPELYQTLAKHLSSYILLTPPKNELLCPKNWVSMELSSDV